MIYLLITIHRADDLALEAKHLSIKYPIISLPPLSEGSLQVKTHEFLSTLSTNGFDGAPGGSNSII